MIVMARASGQQGLLDLIMPYTLGDGVHGWICASNVFRIFPVINRRHAEPALRMMARNFAAEEHWSIAWFAPRLEAARKKVGPLPPGWTDAKGERHVAGNTGDLPADSPIILRAREALRGV